MAKKKKRKKKLNPIRDKKIKKYAAVLISLFSILATIFLVGGLFLLQKKVRRASDLSVLLITLDTTRADRLGCYGYERGRTPNLDGLASKGVRFENAYCQVPLTAPSHCSILTGTYPLYH